MKCRIDTIMMLNPLSLSMSVGNFSVDIPMLSKELSDQLATVGDSATSSGTGCGGNRRSASLRLRLDLEHLKD